MLRTTQILTRAKMNKNMFNFSLIFPGKHQLSAKYSSTSSNMDWFGQFHREQQAIRQELQQIRKIIERQKEQGKKEDNLFPLSSNTDAEVGKILPNVPLPPLHLDASLTVDSNLKMVQSQIHKLQAILLQHQSQFIIKQLDALTSQNKKQKEVGQRRTADFLYNIISKVVVGFIITFPLALFAITLWLNHI